MHDHAWVIFFYYVIGFAAMVVMPHPVLLACTLLILLVIDIVCDGFRKMLKILAANLGLAVVIVGFNLLVNHRGPTTLTTLWGMRLTLESLLYGVQTALLFLCCIRLFIGFSRAMTDEKVMAMLGGHLPGLALVFSMILRLVPEIRRDAGELKKLHGRGIRTWKMLLILTLEGGVIRSISMRDRGYDHPVGEEKYTAGRKKKRTCFYKKRITFGDVVILTGSLIWFGLCLWLWLDGMIYARFFPTLSVKPVEWYVICLWGLYFSLPLLRTGKEEIEWRLSKRRIIDSPMPEAGTRQ